WTTRSPEETREMAAAFELQLRRFVHLQFLREHDTPMYRDARLASEDAADPEVLAGYQRLVDARPWTRAHEWCWRYLSGEVDEPPDQTVVPALSPDLPEKVRERHARDVLDVLREVHTVLSTAAREGRGLYVVMH